MNKFDAAFKRPKKSIERKRKLLTLIRKNLENYSSRHISIKECLSKAGSLTTDLILYHNAENEVTDSARDSIFIVTVNYYAMLYMQLFTGNFTVEKRHTYKQIITLVEDVLKETDKNSGLKTDDINEAMYTSREFSKQMVDIYYRAGSDGCQKYLTASIYSILLPGNGYQAVDREKIDTAIIALDADKFLNGSSGIANTGA
ncbi:hypothetical protein [Rhodohalobacter sp. 8-1]|uniref:hypothetical protein n=1 Tax=Rhodohalobacter sp. 8-1 TaxID=3131972 RepID=UPI0030ED2AE2